MELRKDPDPNATEPTGMCGSPTKCKSCPSDFLCVMKAKGEAQLIAARDRNKCDVVGCGGEAVQFTLCTGGSGMGRRCVAHVQAEALLDSLGVAAEPEVIANMDAVGFAMGFEGGTFFPATYHWFHQGWSVCGRWRSDRATGPFVPVLEDGAHECAECEKAA